MKESTLFRQHHFFKLLEQFDPQKGPLDLFVSLYFRHNHQLGSKDRVYIVERLYAYFRWKGLLEALLDKAAVPEQNRRAALIDLLEQDPAVLSSEASLEPHVRVSFPEPLYRMLRAAHGEETDELCRSCNESAPIVLRANGLKVTREELLHALQKRGLAVEEEPSAPLAIRLLKRVNLWSLPEFTEGLFEVQDAGSQHVADLIQAKPGDAVLDFCSGAGGKTLCFAPRMQNQGQIFLHDVRLEALFEAKRRLNRAGIQNAQTILHTDTSRLSLILGKMDWVLVDVPCSGTGTLRRNPDLKWKCSGVMVARLVEEQRAIFDQALSYLGPHGTIVYATCSLLREENDDQLSHFLSVHPLSLVGEPFRSRPKKGMMDGFFAAALRWRSSPSPNEDTSKNNRGTDD